MKKMICVFLSMFLVLSSCSQSASAWQEQYDLGMRYLSEGNYEEAIIAFTAAIEIDPKRTDAYLQLAEVYIRTNDTENAIRVLTQGIEVCGESDAFTELLDQIQSSDTPHGGTGDSDPRRTNPVETLIPGQEQSVPPAIDLEHLVTDAYRQTISDADHNTYEYVVPQIALAGHDTSQINSEIWDSMYVNVISQQLEAVQQGYSFPCYGTTYDWAVNENILSLWASANYGPTTAYYIYNVDVLTGKKLSNDALLEVYGITADHYKELVRQALYSYNYDDFAIWAANDRLDQEETIRNINWALSESISDENVERALPFFNHDGGLCIAGIAFQIAGADANGHIINLEKFEVNLNYPTLFDPPAEQQKLLSEEEALKIAEEKSGYYDGQFEGDDYVIQFWSIGEQTYNNNRQTYAFQVRRLWRNIEGPTMLIETIYVDVETGQCFWEAMGDSGIF